MRIRRPSKRAFVAAASALLYVLTIIMTIKHFEVKYEAWVAKELSNLEYHDMILKPTRVLLQPHVSYCSNISMLVAVHSRLTDCETRNRWRRTYGRQELINKYNYKLMFVVGTNNSYNDILKEEHGKYGDILQADYVDSYKNLTYKQLSHLRYFTSACQQPTILLKIDDDVVWRVDTVSRVAFDNAMNNSTSPFLSCLVWTEMRVRRDPEDTWFVHPSIFAPSHFPRYCSGMAYLASHSATTAMTKWVQTARFFWVDDAFITGAVRLMAEVGLKTIEEMYNIMEYNDTIWDNDSLAFQLVTITDFENNFNAMTKKLPN